MFSAYILQLGKWAGKESYCVTAQIFLQSFLATYYDPTFLVIGKEHKDMMKE